MNGTYFKIMKHLLLTTIAAVVLGKCLGQQQAAAYEESKKSDPPPEELGVSVMTFNTKWLLGSLSQVKALKEKGIWGLEEKDTEPEIEQQHQAVATIVARHTPDILCLQEVINEIAAKRFQKTLKSKGMHYTLHFLESRDTYLEQDVVFFQRTKAKISQTSRFLIQLILFTHRKCNSNLPSERQKNRFVGLTLKKQYPLNQELSQEGRNRLMPL